MAPKPWRVESAEGRSSASDYFATTFAHARPAPDNEFKLTLAERTLTSILSTARPA
jgi:xanthine dehydrogenase YagS FAD-binding subunit